MEIKKNMKFKRLLVSTLICTWWGKTFNMAPFLSIMLTVMNVISKSYFAKYVFVFSFKASEDDLLRRKSLTFIDQGRDAKKKLLGCTLFLSHRLFSLLIDSS